MVKKVASARAVLPTLRMALEREADPAKAQVLQRFFKTGPGQYGEGDVFLGVTMPKLRRLAKEFRDLGREDVEKLLHSVIHEQRLLGLLILVLRFQQGSEAERRQIYTLYWRNLDAINNWDLVDCSAEHIVGAYLWERDREPLYRLVKSPRLWRRRVSILSTFHYIKRGEFDETLKLAKLLLKDEEDLIHKAVGWMLREVGKRNKQVLTPFLRSHCHAMPRTMLRYAIERFLPRERQAYLAGKV